MKKIHTLFFLIAAVQCLGQSGWTNTHKRIYREADFAFYQGDFFYAEQVFTSIAKEAEVTDALSWRLAACAMERGEVGNHILEKLEGPAKRGEDQAWYYLGRYYHLTYAFDEALDAFSSYTASGNMDYSPNEVDRFRAMCYYGKDALQHPVDVEIRNMGPEINSVYKEYVPVVDAQVNAMYFTSRRPNTTAQLKDPTGQWFEDIYISERKATGWSASRNVGLALNSETHDATVALSGDGQTMIIYRTNVNLTGGDLYITYKRDRAWTNPRMLNERINSPHQESSACLSMDGKVLIFSSDRPGGYGGKDLYRVRLLPNGEWSLPINLGPVINSIYDEDAPSLSPDEQTLYFASNGHRTMGGYDLFKSRVKGDDLWEDPVNLGYPLNTVHDDIFLALDGTGRSGYFSSQRENGFGQLDIYRVEFIERSDQLVVVHGETLDGSSQPLQATVTVLDEGGRKIQGVYTSNRETGKFILVVNPLTTYKVFVQSSGMTTIEDEIFFDAKHLPLREEDIAPYVLTSGE